MTIVNAGTLQDIESAVSRCDTFALDLETTGLNPHNDSIRGFALAAGKQAWYLSICGSQASNRDAVFAFIKALLSNPDKTVVFHNASFDLQFLGKAGIPIKCKLACTLIGAYMLDETRSGSESRLALKGKNGLIDEYYQVVLPTYKQSTLGGMLPCIGKNEDDYACDDARWCLCLWQEKIKPGLQRTPALWKWFVSVEMDVSRIIAWMEYRGFSIDVPFLLDSEKLISDEMNGLETEIYAMAGEQFNISSADQVADVFYNKLKLPSSPDVEVKKSGRMSVDKKFLISLVSAEGEPPNIVTQYLAWKERSTMLRTYVRGMKKWAMLDPEYRVHSKFWQAGTDSGRFASRNPNLQNLARSSGFKWQYTYPIKKAFVARSHYVLLCLDYSQLELRTMTHLCQDPVMLEIYQTGGDIHAMTQKALGITVRSIAKSCVAEGTLVLTANGYVPVEQLIPDTTIGKTNLSTPFFIQSYDALRAVQSVYYGGEQECFRIETDYGIVVEQTADHEMPIVRDGKIIRVETSTLRPGDLAIIKVGANVHGSSGALAEFKVSARTSFKPVCLPNIVTPEMARFLGYFAAEGHGEPSNYSLTIGFGWQDVDVVDDCYVAMRASFGTRVRRYNRPEACCLSVSSKTIFHWLIAENTGFLSGDIEIPLCVRSAPWSIKREFFRAYFEGDGSVSSGVVRTCSKSEKLIRQIQAEMFNVGIVGIVYSEERGTYGQFWMWQTNDTDAFVDKIGFISKRKQSACVKRSLCYLRSVLFLDGFSGELRRVAPSLHRRDRNKIIECLTHNVRLGQTRLTPTVRSCLTGDAKFMVDNNLWTVRIRSITPCGKKRVYDCYEPVHKVFVVNSLVSADCNFALLYGQAPQGLRNYLWRKARIKTTLEECEEWHRRFFNQYKGLREYHEKVKVILRSTGMVHTIVGRPRRLKSLMSRNFDKAFRIGVNFVNQGSAADIIKLAMRDIYRQYDSDSRWEFYDYALLNQVHDELVSECREEYVKESFEMVKHCMENAVKLRVPLVADGGWGKTWHDAKEGGK